MYLQIVQLHEIHFFIYKSISPYTNEIILCLKNILTSIDLDPQERHPTLQSVKKILPSAYINIDNTFMWDSGLTDSSEAQILISRVRIFIFSLKSCV